MNNTEEEKLKLINNLCVELEAKFDNTTPNHYKLSLYGFTFEFSTYEDVINALEIYKGDE